jgi:hypothetical protein
MTKSEIIVKLLERAKKCLYCRGAGLIQDRPCQACLLDRDAAKALADQS